MLPSALPPSRCWPVALWPEIALAYSYQISPDMDPPWGCRRVDSGRWPEHVACHAMCRSASVGKRVRADDWLIAWPSSSRPWAFRGVPALSELSNAALVASARSRICAQPASLGAQVEVVVVVAYKRNRFPELGSQLSGTSCIPSLIVPGPTKCFVRLRFPFGSV